ncbi:hypothetical protein [Streptomyces zagrosensis]|uniref:Uncharacterized protein n=1 Tax=Streptomyces zagrosensis TaxID=1042984 RepID=A0A7W9Q5X3_9ACTN|nr:hypothetical protein [Streptomyces zagrosensis]MBB5933984.1 hypothetical protein [Streptomyces zagrosensis]
MSDQVVMSLKIYRKSPGSPPRAVRSTVVRIDTNAVTRSDLEAANRGMWPPCRCERHRDANGGEGGVR